MSELDTTGVVPAGRSVVVRLAAVLGAFLLSGALAGVLWERWWDAPGGLTYQGRWYLEPAGPDLGFQGVALFVAIAFPLGLVLAVVAGLRGGHEVATVLTVLVAASLAAVVMYAVGAELGPDDPQVLAAGQPDYTPLSGDLVLTAPDPGHDGWRSTALLALPAGAMTGLVGLYLVGSPGFVRRRRG